MQCDSEIKTWYHYPKRATNKIYVVFDAFYMLKLIHRLLADYANSLYSWKMTKYIPVSWEYLTTLNDVQESCGILLGNKLRRNT